MKPLERRAQKLLIEQWDRLKSYLYQLRVTAVRPDDGFSIFELISHPKEAGVVAFTVKPVTFQVPERAGGGPELFIVAQGRIYLDEPTLQAGALKTVRFGSEVAYFRKGKGNLDHIYGAHYDFSLNEVGHPIFHAQMRSYNERATLIASQFEINDPSIDHLENVLRTVRLPTAQMDFFALVMQICADHLMSKDSGKEDKEAFAGLKLVSKNVQGSGHRFNSLVDVPPCMRSYHWYE